MRDTTKAQVLTVVKRMISRTNEDKYSAKDVWNRVGFNSSVSAGDLYGVLPVVNRGDDEFQRTGSKITPKYLRLRGTVAIINTEASSLTPECRLMVLSSRSAKSYYALNQGTVKTDLSGRLLNDGQGNKLPYDGSAIRHFYSINKDDFTVHADKRIKLASSYGAISSQHSADDTRRFAHFDIKIKCPKHLIFEDSLDPNYPTNFAPFVCMGFTSPDDTGTFTVTTPIIGNMHASLVYEDS